MTRHASTTANRLPEAGAGFVWERLAAEAGTERSLVVLRPVVDGVVAAFTTRTGGVSHAPYDELNLSFRVGDSDEAARANREIAGRAVGTGGRWSVVRQIHGSDVVRSPEPGHLPDADGQWTDDPDRTLAVLCADCVPVLIAAGSRLGIAHAGWRGIVAGVIGNGVGTVGGRPVVFAGPAIGPCCYEVGEQVAEAFVTRFGASVVKDGNHIDLWEAAGLAALEAGADRFEAARVCTSCCPALFFSHRRDRGRTGRQALLARLTG